MGSLSFIEKPARKTRPSFFCCMGFLLLHGCSSLSSPVYQTASIASRRLIRASDTVTGQLRTNLRSLATTRTRHVGNDPNVERYDPDLWTDEFAFLSKPGQAEIQSDLFYDYRTNVEAYPKWQAWMREKQPRLLVIWGKYDLSFELSEPEAYRRDVAKAEVHVLEAGHFALDTAADQIAALVRDFVGSSP